MTTAAMKCGFLMVAAASVGCGGLGAGDYEVYRVASTAAQLSADCFNGQPPTLPNTDIRQGATLVLFFGGDETPYLDTGSLVFEGARSGDDYRFLGQQSGSQSIGGGGGGIPSGSVDQTQQFQIDASLDGDVIEGSVRTITTTCQRDSSGACANVFTCTANTSFDGVRVEDELADRGGSLGDG